MVQSEIFNIWGGNMRIKVKVQETQNELVGKPQIIEVELDNDDLRRMVHKELAGSYSNEFYVMKIME